MAISILPGKSTKRPSSVNSTIPFPSLGGPEIVAKPGLSTIFVSIVANVLQRKKKPSESRPLTSAQISLPRSLKPIPPPLSIPSLVRLTSHTIAEPSILYSIRRHLPPLPACPKDWDISSPIRLQNFSPAVVLFAQVWALKQNHPVPDTFSDALQALYQYISAIDEFIQRAPPLDAKKVYDNLPPPVKLHACRTEFISGNLEYLRRRVCIARALKEEFRTRMRELGVEQTREWIIRKRKNKSIRARCRAENFSGHRTPRNLYDAVRDRNCCIVARSRANLDEWERWHGQTRALEEWIDCNIRFDTKSVSRGPDFRFKSPLHHVETL